ncbi:hypothetical protein ACFQH8_05460 [Halomicroarcula sp. GCM10025710]
MHVPVLAPFADQIAGVVRYDERISVTHILVQLREVPLVVEWLPLVAVDDMVIAPLATISVPLVSGKRDELAGVETLCGGCLDSFPPFVYPRNVLDRFLANSPSRPFRYHLNG